MVSAIIFDMDGVIVDSERAHFRAFRDVFDEMGIAFTRERMRKYFGTGPYNVISAVCRENSILPKESIKYYTDKKDTLYRKYFPEGVKSVRDVLDFIRKGKYRQCIASSTSRENIAFALEKLGIGSCFEFFISREDVSRTKPSPDAYNLAVRRLSLPADECIVIEDTLIGISAAKSAGLRVIAVTTTFPREKLAEADYIIDTYGELEEALAKGALK